VPVERCHQPRQDNYQRAPRHLFEVSGSEARTYYSRRVQKLKNHTANAKRPERPRGSYICCYHECGESLEAREATEYVSIPREGHKEKNKAWRQKILRSMNVEYHPTTKYRACVEHFGQNSIIQRTITSKGKSLVYAKLVNTSLTSSELKMDALPLPVADRRKGCHPPPQTGSQNGYKR